MIRSPFILVRTLLEEQEPPVDQPLPPEGDPLPPGDDIDPQQYALDNVERTWNGDPIHGFYQKLVDKLATIRTKKRMQELMGRNCVLRMTYDRDNSIAIRYHETDIITVTPADVATINTGGWHTLTTGERLDDHLPGGWSTYRRFKKIRGYHGAQDEQLYWANRRHPISRAGMLIQIPITDGDVILADGSLKPKAEPIYQKKRSRFWHGGQWHGEDQQ